MRLGPELKSVVGVAGKEKDIEIWQLDTQQSIFKAKVYFWLRYNL
jgi:hypothetical protein